MTAGARLREFAGRRAEAAPPGDAPAAAAPSPRAVLEAAIGGGAIALCFLRFALWPLAWVAFTPIVLAIRRAENARAAAWTGFVVGVVTNVPAFYWLVGTIHRFGGFPLWLSVLFYAVLSVYSALQFVVFALAVRRGGLGPLALGPPLVWVALELVYPNLFPWRLANCQLEVPPLLQIGELTGPYGLSFVMAWFAAAVALVCERGVRAARWALAGSAAAAVAVALYGAARLPAIDRMIESARPIRVGLVQGNLSIEEKGAVGYFEANLQTYRDLTVGIAPRSDVVIWPETVIADALPRSLRRLPDAARSALGLSRPLLTGALTYEGPPDSPTFYNSIALFDVEGDLLGLSDKQILMPFGEYLPLASLFPALKRLSPMTGDFRAGTGVVPLDVPGVARFAPLNCYEDLRAAIARRATREGRAQILFAVANDAWFGDTACPYQHEALALWRAIENRRYLVRVTNTGVTDVIDPAGRVRLRLPIFDAAAAVETVRALDGESVYTRCGDVFAWSVAAAALALLVAPRRIVLPR